MARWTARFPSTTTSTFYAWICNVCKQRMYSSVDPHGQNVGLIKARLQQEKHGEPRSMYMLWGQITYAEIRTVSSRLSSKHVFNT